MLRHRWVLPFSLAISFGWFALACASNDDAEPEDEPPAECTDPQPAPPPPCPDGWFHYTDTVCPYPPGTPCSEAGDLLCYRPCERSADCVDPCKPTCEELILCRGSDACFERVSVCR